VIIGGRVLWHAAKVDAFNNNRSRERVQAISLLATLLQWKPEEPSRNERAFFKEAHRLINDAASGFAQSQPVRVAAKAALEGTTELKALWALTKSSLDNSTNDSLAAHPYGHS
jgi:DnaJ-domain-containing protein 1